MFISTSCMLKTYLFNLHLQESYEDGCEDYPTLSEYVQDFLNHLTEQPGSFETEIDQFAETLNGWVTTDDALQELVELVYQQVGQLVVCSMGWSSGSFLEARGWRLLLEGGQVHVHLPPHFLTLWFMGARSLLYKISIVGDPGLEPDCKGTSVAEALDGIGRGCRHL